MLPMIVSRRRNLVHHCLQLVVMILRRMYRIRMQRMKVMGLIRRCIQLTVQQTRREHRVQRIVAVTAPVRRVL